MSFIKYKEVEEIILFVEDIFKKYKLTPDEKAFILNTLNGRILKAKQKIIVSDTVHNLPFKKLIKTLMKKDDEPEEGGR